MNKIRTRDSAARPALRFILALSFMLPALSKGAAASGSGGAEAASFLDIPVGGRAAALGSGYTALASDSYAPVWNPAGLGFLGSAELSGMHLSYLENITYDFVSFVHPISKGRSAAGLAVQYLRPGELRGTDINGSPTGDFSGHYAAYSLAYGGRLTDGLSFGITGKLIDARISDVGARAYAADAGLMCRVSGHLRLAGAVTGLGSRLTFLDQRDDLTSAFRLGAVYAPSNALDVILEGVYPFQGPPSGHAGLEWTPFSFISLRGGYRSDTVKGLSSAAGITSGIGLHVLGQELDYAWLPLSDLGSAQYLSFSLRFGARAEGGPL